MSANKILKYYKRLILRYRKSHATSHFKRILQLFGENFTYFRASHKEPSEPYIPGQLEEGGISDTRTNDSTYSVYLGKYYELFQQIAIKTLQNDEMSPY